MALLHAATLVPSKPEMLAAWVPTQRWGSGAEGFEVAAAYRFDDPGGEVGIEVFLLTTAGGPVLQVPVTYRAEPRPDQAGLVATMEHSVLGTRHVYDGASDPVFVAALARAVLRGEEQAAVERQHPDGRRESVEPTARVRGTGSPSAGLPGLDPGRPVPTVLDDDGVQWFDLVPKVGLLRVVPAAAPPGGAGLIGTWPGSEGDRVLAVLG